MEKHSDNHESERLTFAAIILSICVVAGSSFAVLYMYLVYASSDTSVINYILSNVPCKLLIPYMELVFIFGFIISLVWSLHLYTMLRQQDNDEHERINTALEHLSKPLLESIRLKNSEQDNIEETKYPYSFHQLAYSHKQWAQLWFTITISIFLGGLIYAVFNVGTHICSVYTVNVSWAFAAKAIIPNVFVYALFFVAWNWSARHFRAHWHNFILNSYRHRALWRYEEIERKLVEVASGVGACDEIPSIKDTVKAIQEKVADTILEMYRLSGILLLLPGESSYLDAGKDEKMTEEFVKLEEIVKSAASRTSRP